MVGRYVALRVMRATMRSARATTGAEWRRSHDDRSTHPQAFVLRSPAALSQAREKQREAQFMPGICGSGWKKRPGATMCALHTAPVPGATLGDYWASLPDDHRRALFSMPEEDVVAELDGHMRYHLKICRDCRLNVTRCFRDLRAGAWGQGLRTTHGLAFEMLISRNVGAVCTVPCWVCM